MAKINIRESLGRRDLSSGNKYDLRNTYDSLNLSESKKKQLAKALYENKSNRIIYSILNESSINTERKLEDIDFVMSYEMPAYFRVSDGGEPGCYIVSYDEYAEVEVKFDLTTPGYVFTIDGKGPFEHSSSEYIPSDISRELDRKIALNYNDLDEALDKRQLRESAYIKQFSRYSREYEKLDRLATFLTAMSPNKYYYYVEDTYFDFGQDWWWTTVIAKRNKNGRWDEGYQALSPRAQEAAILSQSDEELESLARQILASDFCPDKKSVSEDMSSETSYGHIDKTYWKHLSDESLLSWWDRASKGAGPEAKFDDEIFDELRARGLIDDSGFINKSPINEAAPSKLTKSKDTSSKVTNSYYAGDIYDSHSGMYDKEDTYYGNTSEGYIMDKQGNKYRVTTSITTDDAGRIVGGTTNYFVTVYYGETKLKWHGWSAVFGSQRNTGMINAIRDGIFLEDFCAKYPYSETQGDLVKELASSGDKNVQSYKSVQADKKQASFDKRYITLSTRKDIKINVVGGGLSFAQDNDATISPYLSNLTSLLDKVQDKLNKYVLINGYTLSDLNGSVIYLKVPAKSMMYDSKNHVLVYNNDVIGNKKPDLKELEVAFRTKENYDYNHWIKRHEYVTFGEQIYDKFNMYVIDVQGSPLFKKLSKIAAKMRKNLRTGWVSTNVDFAMKDKKPMWGYERGEKGRVKADARQTAQSIFDGVTEAILAGAIPTQILIDCLNDMPKKEVVEISNEISNDASSDSAPAEERSKSYPSAYYDKMNAWHDGKRKQNVKACSDDKLIAYYNICKELGFTEQQQLLLDEINTRHIKINESINGLMYENFERHDWENLIDEQGFVSINDIRDYIWAAYDGDLDDKHYCAKSIVNDYKDDNFGKVGVEIIDQYAYDHNLEFAWDEEESTDSQLLPNTSFNESRSINESTKLSRGTMIYTIWDAPYDSKIFGGPQGVDDTFEAVLCKYLNCTKEELPDSIESVEDAFGKLSDEDLTSLYNDYLAHAFSYVTINNIHKLTDEDMKFLEDLGVRVGSYNFFDAESALDEIDRYANKHWHDKTCSKVLDRILYRCGVRSGYPVDGEYYSETSWDYETALELLDVLNYFWDNNLLKEAIEVTADESKSINEDFDDTYDDDDDGVEEGNRFFADGKDYTWAERIAGPIHLDFDNWAVWSATESVNILDYATEKPDGGYDVDKDAFMKAYMDAPVAYFVVDEDTGFIDWGPCDTDIEAKDFLNGKLDDWENEV